MHEQKAIIITAIIAVLLLLITALFVASVFRRTRQKGKYRRLDALRTFYGMKLVADLDAGGAFFPLDQYRAVPGSLDWQAVEEVLFLLIDEELRRTGVMRLFTELGYVSFYEDLLESDNKVVKESAIDKLGRMANPASAPKLLPLLESADPDILSVTVRVLSKLGSKDGLRAVVEKLPRLLGQSLVARKALETDLLNFGSAAVPVLIDLLGEHADPAVISCVLETLSHFPPDTRSVFLAIERLKDPDPDVRGKALRVLGRPEKNLPAHLPSLVLPLLSDPVWFVRLQAVKTAAALACEQGAAPLGRLLIDQNWQVRGEAALTLARLGDCALDVFLEALTMDDANARESVCEEIERAGFTRRLIENLVSSDTKVRTISQEILKIMLGTGFSAPLVKYVKEGTDERAQGLLRQILAQGEAR